MKEYQAGFNDGTWAVDPKAKPEVQARTKKQAQMLSMGKIYLWTALGLLITGLIAFLTPDVLLASGNTETTANVYVGILIASLAVILPITIVMMILPFRQSRKAKALQRSSSTSYIRLQWASSSPRSSWFSLQPKARNSGKSSELPS
ncbi:MAG: hypothetical protein LKE52_02695 [Bacilli bacterium]|jgi:FtsH-binding integral membrane protein|nr:hypothetical protein [Bacilli bacterium]